MPFSYLITETVNENSASNIKTLYDAALLLRKSINKCEKWVFTESLDTLSKDNCPEEPYCFFRWVIQGPNSTLSAEEKCAEVHKRVKHLSKSTVSICLTERQVKNKESQLINSFLTQRKAITVFRGRHGHVTKLTRNVVTSIERVCIVISAT